MFPFPLQKILERPPPKKKKEKGRTVQALSAQARIGRRHCQKYMVYTPVKRPSTNSLKVAPDTSVTQSEPGEPETRGLTTRRIGKRKKKTATQCEVTWQKRSSKMNLKSLRQNADALSSSSC